MVHGGVSGDAEVNNAASERRSRKWQCVRERRRRKDSGYGEEAQELGERGYVDGSRGVGVSWWWTSWHSVSTHLVRLPLPLPDVGPRSRKEVRGQGASERHHNHLFASQLSLIISSHFIVSSPFVATLPRIVS